MNQSFPYEKHIMSLKEGDEEIIILNGRAFLITPATEDDIERVSKGFFVMD